ncbi:hypothetical protein EDD17DRAFT_1693132 [Pisolithus thermaeus]|nr:hypothetical protein EV401DRAFT_2267689 [Pisolithus croceorrhizus]KAI6163797.1 hypothetical protein EDD17DRAFT_1693132 [Pisolithus thermaeus]
MFARLSRQGTQWLTVCVERSLSSHEDGDGIVSIHLTLASLVSPSDLSWSRVAGLCERSILPVYKSLRDIVEGDIEHVSRLLFELDPLGEHGLSEQDATDTGASAFPNSCSGSPPPEGLRRHCPRPFLPVIPIVRPFDPSAPIVIVTPCPNEPRETSCWVPCQDACFGMRLTVPTHVALNRAYPPLLADWTHPVQRIDEWQYINGHWYAVVPPPTEQCRRGLYSRPASGRVRSRSRCPRSWAVDVEGSVCGS